METRHARFAVFGVGGVLLPFVLVVLFVWLRTGALIGLVPLLGDGDLFPPIAVLAGQVLAAAYADPACSRNVAWIYRVAGAWTLFAGSCVGHAVPHTDAAGFESRLAWTSVVMFGGVVVVSLQRRRE